MTTTPGRKTPGTETTRVRVLPAPPYERPGVPAGAQAADLLVADPPAPVAVAAPRPARPVAVPEATAEARAFAVAVTKQVFEVLDRRRSSAHLAPRVAARLLDQFGVLARANVTRTGGTSTAARVRRVHIQMAGPAAAEIFGTYQRGRRVRAFAGRVERVACRVRPSTGRYQYAPARTEYRWQLVAFTLA